VSGKLRLNVQAVELSEVVDAAADAVRLAAEARGVDIVLTLGSRAGAISGDPERLQQVLWNLLSNAVKFTGRGGAVTVRLTRRQSHVEVTVSDTGIGIAPEFMPRIFERFSQAEGGAVRGQGGLGLGLAIARELVEMHGGTIQASSEGLGRGATFRLLLPLRAERALQPVTGTEEHA